MSFGDAASQLSVLSCSSSLLQVRKAAQHGVCSVLRGSEFLFGDGAPSHHPAASSTAKFCVQEIEKAGGTGVGEDHSMRSHCIMES